MTKRYLGLDGQSGDLKEDDSFIVLQKSKQEETSFSNLSSPLAAPARLPNKEPSVPVLLLTTVRQCTYIHIHFSSISFFFSLQIIGLSNNDSNPKSTSSNIVSQLISFIYATFRYLLKKTKTTTCLLFIINTLQVSSAASVCRCHLEPQRCQFAASDCW